jgi:UDPglucose 6-dehydrogenase
MNEYQKLRFAKQIVESMLGALRGKKIVLFGFAFKKNTGDIRESPAIDVARVLLDEGAVVVMCDPKVKLLDVHELGAPWTKITDERDPYAAAVDAHALVVLTEWDEFKTLDYPRILTTMSKPSFIFDGRNILDHDKLASYGFKVHGIGRAFLFGSQYSY